ncbi:MAG: hypothetical protein LBB49_00775 [Gracilibacteraceae bacterium]|nr:hypothetical protein [Gracilibacteraceae bacterium]
MRKFFKSGFCIILLLMISMSLVGCDENSSGINGEEWETVIEFNGSFTDDNKEAFSDEFELTGGELRVTYDLVTTSTGGNAMIYILPEGWTKTKDANGDLKISVQDISAIGNKTGEQVKIKKEAGTYFIDINTSSVDSYKIKIEEKK